MPVGCGRTESEGDSQRRDGGEERRPSSGLRVMGSSQASQATLLLQIFPRRPPRDPPGQTGRGPLACPTCKPFSPTCCQAESGWAVLSSLVRTNVSNVWNTNLLKTITRLRYQVIIS